jgi:EAL domain-containing protein (putative c-di-GMP-specific phosphodiesterase class I)
VERSGQLDVLRETECELAQGFLLARPAPLGELRASLLATAAAPA